MRLLKYCILVGILILACQPKQLVKHKTPAGTPPAPALKPLPDSAQVLVGQENVRESPNGVAFATLHKNEIIYIMGHLGNWVLFQNNRFDSVFVWGNANDSTIVADTAIVTYVPGAVNELVFIRPESTVTLIAGSGSTDSVQVSAIDANGNPVANGTQIRFFLRKNLAFL